MAYKPSLPRARLPGPSSVGNRQTLTQGPRDQRPSQRAPGLRPPESPRSRGSSRDCPETLASGRLLRPPSSAAPGLRPPESPRSRGSSRDCPETLASGPQPGLRPATCPPPRHRVRQEPIPTQARASATGAMSTGQQVDCWWRLVQSTDEDTGFLSKASHRQLGNTISIKQSVHACPLGNDAAKWPWERCCLGNDVHMVRQLCRLPVYWAAAGSPGAGAKAPAG
jgi:hypothetical protein